MFDQFILNYATEISILIRMISIFILLIFCIPLQIKEANVKNGLRILRYQLLTLGILLIFVNIMSVLVLISNVNTPQHLFNSYLQLINAIAFLCFSIVGNRMYHTQYTDEMKEMHKKIDKLEHLS